MKKFEGSMEKKLIPTMKNGRVFTMTFLCTPTKECFNEKGR
jgi:hypothetical protein